MALAFALAFGFVALVRFAPAPVFLLPDPLDEPPASFAVVVEEACCFNDAAVLAARGYEVRVAAIFSCKGWGSEIGRSVKRIGSADYRRGSVYDYLSNGCRWCKGNIFQRQRHLAFLIFRKRIAGSLSCWPGEGSMPSLLSFFNESGEKEELLTDESRLQINLSDLFTYRQASLGPRQTQGE